MITLRRAGCSWDLVTGRLGAQAEYEIAELSVLPLFIWKASWKASKEPIESEVGVLKTGEGW